jgi:hypothetical protein
MSDCILTPEQFAFMQAHHELVEYAIFALSFGETVALDTFMASEDYQKGSAAAIWDGMIFMTVTKKHPVIIKRLDWRCFSSS